MEWMSHRHTVEDALERTDFNLKRTKRIQKKKTMDKVAQKNKKVRQRFKSLKPRLNANLSGSDFGLNMGGIDDVDMESEVLEGDKDVIMDEKSVDEKPRILEKSSIEFPERALSDNILRGVVELRMLITKEGKVENMNILSAIPKGYFEDVTLAMVSAWRFQPARYQGRPVAIWARQVVKFGE